MSALVDFPIAEEEALLKRLADDPAPSMTAAECDAAEAGRIRIEQAVRAERGPGGYDECEATRPRLRGIEEAA